MIGLRCCCIMLLDFSATQMAALVRSGQVSSVELVEAHLAQIEQINPALNAAVVLLSDDALAEARAADERLARGEITGPLHGVPFSVKDSIDVRGTRSTAGTTGRRAAAPASEDATVVARLRAAGGIPLAKTNLPDLLFSFETDNLLFGRSNNPYDLARTPGGSSGGESALIAAGGSPLGLGSDALGSVRVPAAFCGITSIKPTHGRVPRTGHVPPSGGWSEAIWQIGPMARRVEDLVLAMQLLAGADAHDFTTPSWPLDSAPALRELRVAVFTDNGFAPCGAEVRRTVEQAAAALAGCGLVVHEARPPGVEHVYELELALLGADGNQGVRGYLENAGSVEVHALLEAFLGRMQPYATGSAGLAARWAEWDNYRSGLHRFFTEYDLILCPVYPQTALEHGASVRTPLFEGFSYTMAWSLAGTPAATVRCGEHAGLPINVQVVAKPWRDMTALSVCQLLERQFGGWRAPPLLRTALRTS